jgi:hypothetical protein
MEFRVNFFQITEIKFDLFPPFELGVLTGLSDEEDDDPLLLSQHLFFLDFGLYYLFD